MTPATLQNLADLLSMELDYHVQIEKMKREIEQEKDFSTLDAFRAMDIKGFNYLDFENFFLFLQHTGRRTKYTRKHIFALLRRLDINADAKITFNEFA